jgi:hypothetical protein
MLVSELVFFTVSFLLRGSEHNCIHQRDGDVAVAGGGGGGGVGGRNSDI